MPKTSLMKPGTNEMVLGKFTLTASGLVIEGRPTLDEYQKVGHFIDWSLEAAPWWKADWLAYGETRADWKELLAQAVEVTGLAEKTLLNMKAVAEQIPPSRRREDVHFSVHAAVASLPPKQQVRLLARAAEERLGVREVQTIIRVEKRRRVIEGQAKLEGMFRVIYADPPWAYNDKGDGKTTAYGRSEAHYSSMTIEQLCKLPVAAHAMPNAVLFMWVTAPTLLQNPGPREVGEAWGFTYKQNIVWDKVLGMFGHYTHGRHEHLTIWTRGDGLPDVDANWLDSVQTFRRTEHSAKPPEFYGIIEKLYTTGPYMELFAREKRKNWAAFGNDARLWQATK